MVNKLLLCFFISILLSGCGLKGSLYMPEENAQEQTEEITEK